MDNVLKIDQLLNRTVIKQRLDELVMLHQALDPHRCIAEPSRLVH